MMVNILTLDGGGSKGIYTIGVLKELEQMFNVLLCEKFDYIYGTSTGSIIAALIGLGYPMQEIETLYLKLIPIIMSGRGKNERSKLLYRQLHSVLGDQGFTAFKTGIGIVATNYNENKPLIFKTQIAQAFKMKASFEPGFGATIVQAIMASSAAYPIFAKFDVRTKNQHTITAIDGGFVGNNPLLFAITDVLGALKMDLQNVSFLSVGTGNFIEKPIGLTGRCLKWLWFVRFFERIMKANANTIEQVTKLLYPNMNLIRINDSFNQPEYGTNMVEKNMAKLEKMSTLGRNSFAKVEDEIRKMFSSSGT